MPATFFIVRAVVPAPERQKFDRWYATEHLPWAAKAFRCERAWRGWSTTEEGVHYATYRFADRASCDRAMASDDLKALIADFDKNFPAVTRTRDVVALAQEQGA
jgi:hypothetical protein